MSRRVLVVSPHFPPVNAPDMQRIRASLPAFVRAGWHVTVLTVDDPTPAAAVESELLDTVPAGVQIVRARCWSRRWTALFGVNNVALRSLPFLFLRGCRLLSGHRYDVVYFSTTMFIVLPFGRIWRALFGVPYVIDFQDPWVSDFYAQPGAPPPPGGWKYHLVRASRFVLEGWSLRRVAQLVSVSSAYLVALKSRYAFLRDTPATELPFGLPDRDLQRVAERLPSLPSMLSPAGGLRLGFAGAISPAMRPAVEVLLAGVAEARRAALPVTVDFFGTSYSHQPDGPTAIATLAAAGGLDDCVRESPARLDYFRALQVTLETDANLLFGSTELSFIPSKLLTVLGAGRPVLAIAPEGSAMVARLAQFGQTCVTFREPLRLVECAAIVSRFLQDLSKNRAPTPDRGLLDGFSADTLAERQMEILNEASQAT
jgi:hypothetical protein